MPKLRESTTSVIVRGEPVGSGFASEPYEAGWASEAIVFLRRLDDAPTGGKGSVHVQISADGMHWADDGTVVPLPVEKEVTFGRIVHFGNWLRLRAELVDSGPVKLLATLHLKG